MRRTFQILVTTVFLLQPALFISANPQSAPNISVTGSLSTGKVKRGQRATGTIVMDVPSGFHTNSNRPLEKFLIPTELKVEGPREITIGPSLYPRAVLRSVKFSKSKVSVFEGRTTMRFNVTVPRSFSGNSAELRARLRFQSCNDDTCFPPQTRQVKLYLNVE
jgi:thiol:disulfide interchange protein DsbD